MKRGLGVFSSLSRRRPARIPPMKLRCSNMADFVSQAKARGLTDAQIRALARAEILSPTTEREFWRTHTQYQDLQDQASVEAATLALDRQLEAAGLPQRDPYAYVANENKPRPTSVLNPSR